MKSDPKKNTVLFLLAVLTVLNSSCRSTGTNPPQRSIQYISWECSYVPFQDFGTDHATTKWVVEQGRPGYNLLKKRIIGVLEEQSLTQKHRAWLYADLVSLSAMYWPASYSGVGSVVSIKEELGELEQEMHSVLLRILSSSNTDAQETCLAFLYRHQNISGQELLRTIFRLAYSEDNEVAMLAKLHMQEFFCLDYFPFSDLANRRGVKPFPHATLEKVPDATLKKFMDLHVAAPGSYQHDWKSLQDKFISPLGITTENYPAKPLTLP